MLVYDNEIILIENVNLEIASLLLHHSQRLAKQDFDSIEMQSFKLPKKWHRCIRMNKSKEKICSDIKIPVAKFNL